MKQKGMNGASLPSRSRQESKKGNAAAIKKALLREIKVIDIEEGFGKELPVPLLSVMDTPLADMEALQ